MVVGQYPVPDEPAGRRGGRDLAARDGVCEPACPTGTADRATHDYGDKRCGRSSAADTARVGPAVATAPERESVGDATGFRYLTGGGDTGGHKKPLRVARVLRPGDDHASTRVEPPRRNSGREQIGLFVICCSTSDGRETSRGGT